MMSLVMTFDMVDPRVIPGKKFNQLKLDEINFKLYLAVCVKTKQKSEASLN